MSRTEIAEQMLVIQAARLEAANELAREVRRLLREYVKKDVRAFTAWKKLDGELFDVMVGSRARPDDVLEDDVREALGVWVDDLGDAVDSAKEAVADAIEADREEEEAEEEEEDEDDDGGEEE